MKAEPAGPTIDIGDGWKIPERIEITAPDRAGMDVEITAEYRHSSGRYEAAEVRVRRRGAEVTGAALRQVPVAAILRECVAFVVRQQLRELATRDQLETGADPDSRALAEQGPTDDTLRRLTQIYRFATLLGDPPAQRVAEAMGISRSAASNWAIRARDRGMLTVRDPRGGRRVVEGTARADLGFTATAEGE